MLTMRLKHWNASVVVLVGEQHDENYAGCRRGSEAMVTMLTLTCGENDVDGEALEGVGVDVVVGSSGSAAQDGDDDEFGIDDRRRDVPSFSRAVVALKRMNN